MTPEEIEKLRENYRSALQEIELLNEESREQAAEIDRLRKENAWLETIRQHSIDQDGGESLGVAFRSSRGR